MIEGTWDFSNRKQEYCDKLYFVLGGYIYVKLNLVRDDVDLIKKGKNLRIDVHSEKAVECFKLFFFLDSLCSNSGKEEEINLVTRLVDYKRYSQIADKT